MAGRYCCSIQSGGFQSPGRKHHDDRIAQDAADLRGARSDPWAVGRRRRGPFGEGQLARGRTQGEPDFAAARRARPAKSKTDASDGRGLARLLALQHPEDLKKAAAGSADRRVGGRRCFFRSAPSRLGRPRPRGRFSCSARLERGRENPGHARGTTGWHSVARERSRLSREGVRQGRSRCWTDIPADLQGPLSSRQAGRFAVSVCPHRVAAPGAR